MFAASKYRPSVTTPLVPRPRRVMTTRVKCMLCGLTSMGAIVTSGWIVLLASLGDVAPQWVTYVWFAALLLGCTVGMTCMIVAKPKASAPTGASAPHMPVPLRPLQALRPPQASLSPPVSPSNQCRRGLVEQPYNVNGPSTPDRLPTQTSAQEVVVDMCGESPLMIDHADGESL